MTTSTTEHKLMLLRVQLFAAAQTLTGADIESLRELLGEVSSILPSSTSPPRPAVTAAGTQVSGERVDLDDLRALAVTAQESARKRGEHSALINRERFAPERWILAPRRDSAVDVVVGSSGADVFDRALLVDAAFAVAAQPAVVIAILDRIAALEQALGGLVAECEERTENPEGDYYAEQRELVEKGVVLP